MEELAPAPKQNKFHALAYVKIGLFEFGFVIIVLILLFGLLNYFNILPVSDVFPQLSFLPRQKTNLASQGQALRSYGGSGKNATSSPANFTPATFQYDTARAEKLLTDYIKSTLKPEFLPTDIKIKQGLSIDNRLESSNFRQFGIYYDINTSTISANFHFKENENTPNDYIMFIQPSAFNAQTATVDLANSLLSSYFIDPSVISECKKTTNVSYCENFQVPNEGKRGYGIAIFPGQGNLVFACYVPRESKAYETQKSCLRLD